MYLKTLKLSRPACLAKVWAGRAILQREVIVEQALVKVLGLLSFVTLTALGAYVRIPLPFTPVPVTLQTFFVLLSGAVLGRKWGPASQVAYLVLGVLGLPLFTGANATAAYLFGPTGGYLIGFALSSWVAASLLKRSSLNNKVQIVAAMVTGSLAGIYLFGILGLMLFLRCSLAQALALGFFPFILGDAVKIICASLIFFKIEKRCREIFTPYH